MRSSEGFAVWLTGLPASGKSSVAGELVKKLEARGVRTVVLESDAMRRILTPEPAYSPEERDRFYRTLVLIGEMLIHSGVNVIFDATANKRAYRDHARSLIRKFVEVFIDCPLDVCVRRDPKGVYAAAASGGATTVPGVQASYEPPLHPELILDGQAPPEAGAERVIHKLKEFQYI